MLSARALKPEASIDVDWNALLIAAITKNGGKVDPENPRHKAALDEQALALERITTRRLSVLIGQAGTGKTSIVGALVECDALKKVGFSYWRRLERLGCALPVPLESKR